MTAQAKVSMLVATAAGRRLGLPVADVVETLRPQPVAPVAGLPAWVTGVAVIRGAALPVVDARRLLGETGAAGLPPPTRFVTLRSGARRVALAVDAVSGVHELPAQQVGDLPPLLAAGAGVPLQAVGALDRDLMLVLGVARLLPDSAWARLDQAGAP